MKGKTGRRDYARPVKDMVLYGPPAPPQHMTDDLKVFIALQDQPMELVSFGRCVSSSPDPHHILT